MQVPIPVRRLVYRCAYTALRGYWLVRRPHVLGVKCILTRADQVLLVRHTYGDREWDFPGGSVKRHEPPLNAARREMHEELGVRIDDWVALGPVAGSAHHRRDEMHCFQAELRDGQIEINRGELAAAAWFARDQLPDDVGRYVRRILARAAG
jgi:8-oxo-dGTP diphosphatase